MTDRQHELDQLRASMADDPAARAKLIAGLGDVLAARDAEVAGERAQIVDAAESGDEGKRGGLLSALIATGVLLYIPPAIAARVFVGQDGGGSSQPQLLVLVI
jgi:hypothetical protein